MTAWSLLLLAGIASPGPGPAPAEGTAYGKVLAALEMWDLPQAHALIASLEQTEGDTPVVNELRGRERFFSGDYAGATQLLSGTESPYAGLAASTLAETQAYEQKESPHFLLRYPRGKDEILVPYALQTLEEARARIGQDLGFLPDDRIRVENPQGPFGPLAPLVADRRGDQGQRDDRALQVQQAHGGEPARPGHRLRLAGHVGPRTDALPDHARQPEQDAHLVA